MDWWQRLKNNSLARLGFGILVILYISAIGADFIAPYDPYEQVENASLLPPTKIYWYDQQGRWIGPHVYPTTAGKTDLETGERLLEVDYSRPSPIRLFVKTKPYRLWQVKLPLPPRFEEVEVFPGFLVNRRLFGTIGEGRLNLLGTDEQGRDEFSRLLHGGKISLFIGIFGILISFPLGMIIGGIAGYFGGIVDTIIMRLIEVLMTIPGIYLLVTLAAVLPPSLSSGTRFLLIVIITSFLSWSGLARIIRGQVLAIREQEFVLAAKALGANPFYIILRHILPHTSTYVIISATLSIPSFIIAESVLSLIGLGIQQPDPSWGNLLSVATNASILVLQPWLVYPPAFLIVLTVLCFNLVGDGLRDALEPKS